MACPSAARNWRPWMTIAAGVDAFFAPNPLAFAGPQHPLGADRAGYYSTDMLRKTLGELSIST